MTDLTTAVADLRADAGIWNRAADRLAAPRSAMPSLTLGDPAAVPGRLATAPGVDTAYDQVRHELHALLGQAATAFTAIATDLIDLADAYDRQRPEHGSPNDVPERD